jgi:hypothetical protein
MLRLPDRRTVMGLRDLLILDLSPRDSDSYRDHVCGGGGNSEFGANPSGTGALEVAGPAAMLRPLRRALWCSGSET